MSAHDNSALAFDRVADRHDHMRWDCPPGAFDVEVQRELARLAQRPKGTALFLGSGSGREVADFAANGWRCDLVDISSRMVELARSRFIHTQVHLSQVYIYRCDALRFLAQSSGKYDLVAMVGELLGYVQSPPRLLAEVADHIGPKGKAIFTWVDSTRLDEAEPTDAPGTVLFREREDLVIHAWTEAIMDSHLRAAGLNRTKDVAAESDSPRRCWEAGRE